MILYPNAKINIGLNITAKRTDGYHNIETVFYPIQLSDILEIVVSDRFEYTQSGLVIDCDIESNLVVKAYRLMQQHYNIAPIKMHLHKIVPFGAGLGGGSSDAAFVISGINELFNLNLSETQMTALAAQLGSDCPFFILNRPVYAKAKGDEFSNCSLNISDKYLVLVKPNVHVTTAAAYAGVKPKKPAYNLKESITEDIKKWNDLIKNDFEKSVFNTAEIIAQVKNELYAIGAAYASMSGSGSSVYGLFDQLPDNLETQFEGHFLWTEKVK